MNRIIAGILWCMLVTGCADQEPSTSEPLSASLLPPESIYMLKDSFETQDHQQIILASFAGKPTIVGMIFTHCGYACPRLTADIQGIEQKLGKDKGKVNFLLVSFDSERDTPEQLKQFANTARLDKEWTLLHGDEEAVRTLSVLLDVQFEKDADGNFSHSNVISVLDQQGVISFREEGLEEDPQAIIEHLRSLW